MSPSTRVWLVVGAAAAAAAGIAVGVTLATRSDVEHQRSKPPPFAPDSTALPEVTRQVREALAAWPAGTVRRLRILAARYPDSALVRLELGLALAFSGQDTDAARAWREAERVQPDSPSAVRAQDLRHPRSPLGLPPFVPSFVRPTTAAELHLLRGAAFQQELHPVSAEREFAAAVRAAPDDPEALTARRFPHAQTVRFHLGLLLIYFGDLPRARRELALARAEGPRTRLGKRADTLLKAGRKR